MVDAMQQAMTPQQEREYAEKCWDEPRHELRYRSAGQMDGGADPDEHRIYSRQNTTLAAIWGTEAEAWHAAYLFTKERERQVADVEEEIRLLNVVWPTYYPSDSKT